MARFTVEELKDRQQELISRFITEPERWKSFWIPHRGRTNMLSSRNF